MNIKNKGIALAVLIVLTLLSAPSIQGVLLERQATNISSVTQNPFAYYGENAQYFFPSFSSDKCGENQDFFLEIPIDGCSPAVIRSDLLEEQDVPVLCRLVGTKLNPLIEIPYIKTISLNAPEKNSSLIKHITFHPARAGLKSTFTNLISSPQLNDLGYLVVILKRQETEKNMPDIVMANLTTKITYVMEKSFGVADNQLLIPVLDENEWKSSYKSYGFWKGKGYIRVDNIAESRATIEMYRDEKQVFDKFILKEGEETNPKFMPGSYCSSGYMLKLEDVEYPSTKAEIYVDGDKFVVHEGMALGETGCTVRRIIIDELGLGGTVELSCPDGKYELSYGARGEAQISIDVNGESEIKEKYYGVGEKINMNNIDGKDPQMHLAYTLAIPSQYDEKTTRKIVVIAQIGTGRNTNKIIKEVRNKIKDSIVDENLYRLKNEEIKEIIEKALGIEKKDESWVVKYLWSKPIKWLRDRFNQEVSLNVIIDEGEITLGNNKLKVKVTDIKGLQNKMHDDATEMYYKKAIDSYKEVAERYGAVYDKDGNPFGAKALYEASSKAEKLEKERDRASFLNKIVDEYPNSGIVEDAKKELNDLYSLINNAGTTKHIESDGRFYTIKLTEVRDPTEDELNVELSIDNQGELVIATLNDEPVEGWTISKIDDKKVYFTNRTSEITINQGTEKSLDATKVKVVRINMKKMARVSIKPWSNNGVTYANFTFTVGIEKRAIQLNPEETKKLIAKLDEKIKKWGEVYDKLGNVVKSWKQVCLIGAGTIWALNTLENLGTGKTIARNKVMRGFGENQGIMDECANAVSKGEYKSQTLCLLDKEDEIEKRTQMWETAIEDTNNKIAEIKKDDSVWTSTKAGILGTKRVLNRNALSEKLGEDIFGEGKLIELNNGKDAAYLREEGLLFSEEEKDLAAYMSIKEQCDKGGADAELCSQVNDKIKERQNFFNDEIDNRVTRENALTKVAENLGNIPTSSIGTINLGKNQVTPKWIVSQTTPDKFRTLGITNIAQSEKTSIFRDESTASVYFAVLGASVGNRYNIDRLFKIDTSTGKIEKELKDEGTGDYGVWPKNLAHSLEGVNCADRNYEGTKEVKFWESGNYKGLVAFMPLTNIKSGLYMMTTPSYSGGTTSYQDSGKIENFWICSVGNNGKPDYDFSLGPRGDDSECCILVNRYYELKNEDVAWLGLDNSKINQIRRCVDSVESKFSAGKKDFASECCTDCKIGKPAVSVSDKRCEDFMDPSDCNLMFNLCDPVICPSSRCDFGGRYPVDNVIQTGIIGGLTLCLPNAVTENIAVPLCLTGIHAGLDNVLTILKSSRDCLNESLTTGKQVGICDQITSIYWCELLWREMTPLLKIGIPSLIEKGVLGGIFGTRKTGGEYLTFTDSWNTAFESAKYVADYYGDEVFEVFRIRSLAQAGSFVCKQFISLKYPDSADLLDELTEPESPYQATAFMQEIPFTTATVPAMSQYKVYYHIYAGRDDGHYYTIYLRQQGVSGYYQTPEIAQVPESTGYLQVGQVTDKAVDFTAPAGYTEVCVRIDGKDECGFGKASTSFAVNEIANLYAEDQATSEATTAEECISGTSGLIAPSLNPQELVSETVNPAIYKRGIVRICSSKNPGEGTNAGRWTAVGFCDSDRKIKCWLDGDSVKNAINDLGIQNRTISEAKSIADLLLGYEGYMSRAEAEALYNKIEDMKPGMIQQLEELFKGDISKAKDADIKKIIGTEDDEDSIIGGLMRIINYGSIDSEDIQSKAQLQIGAVYNKVAELLMPVKEIAEPEAETNITTESEIIAVSKDCPGKKWESQIKNIAAELGLPEKIEGYNTVHLIESLISLESGGNEKALSEQGAAGLMQLMPATASGLEEKYRIDVPDYTKETINGRTFYGCRKGQEDKCDYENDGRFDAEKNIKAGTWYLWILYKSKGNIKDALGSYLGEGKTGDVLGTTSGTYSSKILDSYYPQCSKEQEPVEKLCVLKRAIWNITEATEGQEVKIIVNGENCAGEEIIFAVKEADLLGADESAKIQPKITKFETYREDMGVEYSRAETTWIVEYTEDGLLQGNPEYKFIARIPRLSENDRLIERASDNELTATKMGGLEVEETKEVEVKVCEIAETEKIADNEIKISILNPAMFEYNKIDIKEGCSEQLKQELETQNLESGDSIIIEGYASREGDYEYNTNIARERAEAVEDLIASILFESDIEDVSISIGEVSETDKFSRQKYAKQAVDAEVARVEALTGEERIKEATESEILSLDRRVVIRIIK